MAPPSRHSVVLLRPLRLLRRLSRVIRRMALVNRVLALRQVQLDRNCLGIAGQIVIRAVGLETSRNHLQSQRRPDRHNIELDLAFFIGLQLHVPIVLSILEGMKDDGGMFNRLLVVGPQHRHRDIARRRRWLVLPPAPVLLSVGRGEKQKQRRSQRQPGAPKTAIHIRNFRAHNPACGTRIRALLRNFPRPGAVYSEKIGARPAACPAGARLRKSPNLSCMHRLPLRTSRLSLAALLAGALLPQFSRAQAVPSPSVDAAALVRRAVANRLAADAIPQPVRFVFHKRDERRDFTQEIIETRQGDVALTIAANGRALGPIGHQAQIDRLHNLATHPDLQERRRKREQADAARVDKLLRQLPDAYLYREDSIVPCTVTVPPFISIPGDPTPPPASAPPPVAQCYHLTFKPNPAFDPPDAESKVLTGMAGEVWIETSQERLVRLRAHLIDNVEFGWGIIGRLDKGGTVFLEQTNIGNDNWQLTRMQLKLTGKALLVKSLSFRITEEMSRFSPVPADLDYRKAIRILLSEQPPAANPATKP